MANYVLLEKITVGAAGASSVTFNNIPQTGYTDLKVVCSVRTARNTGDASSMSLLINGSTTSRSARILYGNGTSASSYTDTILEVGYADQNTGNTANTFSNSEFYIPNYTSSNYKSVSSDSVLENNASNAYQLMTASLWSNTAAVTYLTLLNTQGFNIVQYSTFSLYALAAVGTTPVKAPKAIGGDIIQTDGTYWYHAFLSSGSFTPQTALSCDVLVVAGGGGGGETSSSIGAAGGGAGGVLAFASQALTANASNIVTVGAGGAGASTTGANGTQGATSLFGSLTPTSVGGGYGAGAFSTLGGNGGSGGGGSAGGGTSYAGGTATTNQGYAGGANNQSRSGAGGGGAGGVGSSSSGGYSTVEIAGQAGGAGINTYTNATWLSSALTTLNLGVSGYIAGGGGGGAYSNGGASNAGGTTTGGGGAGGTAGSSTSVGNGSAGVANTGSGGGGGGANGGGATGTGGAGGSGVVIIRYAY
jgi:hypothetical protein